MKLFAWLWDFGWASIFAFTICALVATVDAMGSHSLCCKQAFGRITRHQNLNELTHRTYVSANIPVIKESNELFRTDGKRPDVLTHIPWQAGKLLTSDVIVSHTIAASYPGIPPL